MAWTQFTARMRDGMEFEFGTAFATEFFAMPEGYTGKDIVKIVPATRRALRAVDCRERPFFKCYVDGL